MVKKEDNKEPDQLSKQDSAVNEFDASGKSLSEALEISFIILKVIMVILVIAFLASGFKTVGPEEQALVLRFGKIKTLRDGKRTLGPGPHWIMPYPIDKIVKIPVERRDYLRINTFWYYLSEEEQLSGNPPPIDPNKPMDPTRDGYCLTRSEGQNQGVPDAKGNDYNIVHTKWQLTYQIINPELFYTNVYIPDEQPGDIYDDVIKNGAQTLLKSMFEDVIVTTMINYTIEEAITSRDRIPNNVKTLLQDKLDPIESGIIVESVQLIDSEVPRQVKPEYEASTKAAQETREKITQAKSNAETLLTDTAGTIARQLYDALNDDAVSEETKELLWSQLLGRAQKNLAQARIDRTDIVKDAEASAKYFQSLLPEYRQRPEIVIDRLYYDAIKRIFANADEKFTYQVTEDAQGSEIWININRDKTLESKDNREQTK